jgi:DNA-directed RNA polymerase I, II, and III subunit RPABC1
MSLNIELNAKEINIIVCKNLLKMLKRRKLIDDDLEKYEEIKNDINDKAIIEIKLKNTKYSIYLVNGKLNSIAQGTPLDDYLSNHVDIHKIVILKEAAKKVLKQIKYDYKNAEYFFEHEMLEDIPSKVFIPEHQLLTEEEKKEFLEKYNESDLPLILTTDMMTRYFDAKINDIFRIIRPCLNSGKSIFYRRVHEGSLDLIYN